MRGAVLSLRTPSILRLAGEPSGLHPAAKRVVELLSPARGPDRRSGNPHIAAVRRDYDLSRRQFLNEMEAVESIVHICPAQRDVPRLTIMRPRGSRTGDRLPALVYMHGGGWSLGNLSTYEPFCRQLANATGMIIIWVEYRLAPEHPFPAAYEDTLAAWRWITENHSEIGADPNRIAIGGDSAGGNLVAAACLSLRLAGNALPWRQVLLYPCLDLTASLPSHDELADGYLLTAELYAWYRANYVGLAGPRDMRLSPLFAGDLRGLPPTILLYCGFDPLRDEAEAYAKKLAIGGVPVETVYMASMIHGFLNMGGVIPVVDLAVRRIASFLRN